MPLYQPSNITPSTFAGIGAGVIDANDYMAMSWQVNGTSPMIGFDIDIYENTPASTLVAHRSYTFMNPGTGRGPVYGTDARGNVQMYVFDPTTPVTWASLGLTNGNSYKLKITQKWKNDPYDADEAVKTVVQNSESVFITRATPVISVSPGSGTLSSVSQTFTASYSQAQGDGISSVRWVLSDSAGNVLDDTGTIYTGLLSYTYDGFFTGQTYSLKCTVQSSSGAEVSVTNNYAVSYETAEQAGGISLSCNPDDSVTLSWAAGADIPGIPSADDYGTLTGGVLHLAAERSITWNTVNGEDMAFSSPYCFAWRGRIGETITETETVNSGTWELWKTYPETRNTTESHTMSTGAWAPNPSASTTGTRRKTVIISVNNAWESSMSLWATDRVMLNALGSYSGGYTYRNTIPATLTLDHDIVYYQTGNTYYSSTSNWYRLADAYCDVSLSSDKRTLSVTVYTNTDAAYQQEIYVTFDIMYAEHYRGMLYESPTTGDTGISNAVIVSKDSQLTQADISYSSSQNRFTITARAANSGSYSVTYEYNYTVVPNNAYMAKWGGTLSVAGGTLTSASVVSTTATGGAVVSANRNTSGQSVQNAYAVTEYNANNTAATQTVIRLTYTVQVTGAESYRTIVTGVKTGAQSASIQSTTAQRATVTMDADGNYTVTMYYSSNSSTRTATILFTIPTNIAMPNFAFLLDSNINSMRLTVTDSGHGNEAVLNISSERVAIPAPTGTWEMVAIVRPYKFETIWINSSGTVIGSDSVTFTNPLPSPVTVVSLNGPQNCDFTYISQDPNFDFTNRTANPGWDGNTLFYAAFADDLQAGTVGSDDSLSVAVYRQEGTVLSPIGVFGSDVKVIRDYAIRSGTEYRYEMFYITSGAYSAGAESAPMCRQFRQHTLIEAEEDASLPGVYHPVNVWRFRDNVDAGAYTNQNQPVLLENFTKYPLWQPSSPAAKAGTLTALLGWFENGVYSGDNAAAMDALYALSESINPLFYRDMKGNLYMVRLAGPITQTIDNNSASLPVSVSVPWVEVGDADGVRIYAEG